MSRTLFAIAGILFCSSGLWGQEFVVPQNGSLKPPSNTGFQPPANPGFAPAGQQKAENEVMILPTRSDSEGTANNNGRQEIDTTRATIQQIPDLEPLNATNEQATEPTINLPSQAPQPSGQLPAPRARIQPIQLKPDTQIYASGEYNNAYGVSQYRVEVAREKARARRMRMEVNKWYGIDPARPVVAPRVDLSTYSAYYNGVFSRPNHLQQHGGYFAPHFYYHFPVGR